MITFVSTFPANPISYVMKRIRELSNLDGEYKLYATDNTIRIILNERAQFTLPPHHHCAPEHMVSLELYGESKRIVGFPTEAHAQMWLLQYSDWIGGQVINHSKCGWTIIKPYPTYDFDKDLIQPVVK